MLQMFIEVLLFRRLITRTLSPELPCLRYGQTGSGKTFTMQGSEGARGKNLNDLRAMFACVEAFSKPRRSKRSGVDFRRC